MQGASILLWSWVVLILYLIDLLATLPVVDPGNWQDRCFIIPPLHTAHRQVLSHLIFFVYNSFSLFKCNKLVLHSRCFLLATAMFLSWIQGISLSMLYVWAKCLFILVLHLSLQPSLIPPKASVTQCFCVGTLKLVCNSEQ
jgi:hypothetical protein